MYSVGNGAVSSEVVMRKHSPAVTIILLLIVPGSLFALGKEFFRKVGVKAAGTVIELDGNNWIMVS